MGAAAHHEARAVFAERFLVGGHIGLVGLRVADIDVGDPVSLRHVTSFMFAVCPFSANQCPLRRDMRYLVEVAAISATIASADAFGSAASVMGRPITR